VFVLVLFALVVEFDVFVVVFEVPVFAFVVVVVVVVVVDVFALVFTVVLARLAFVFAFVAVLLAAPPHANPRAPRAKTDESAIAFFILFFKSPVFFKE
jgi:hypothetical protein